MTIIWYGHSCFKMTNQGGRLTIMTDPFDKSIGLNPPRGSADIVTISHRRGERDNIKAITGKPFVVDGPGEYEIKGVEIVGISSFCDKKKGAERGQNTIYALKVDKIKICHLGDLGQEKLSNRQLAAIGQIDILMAPIGGVHTIGAKETARISKQIEPQIIIPMRYKQPGLKLNLAGLDEFLKEMGVEEKTAVGKLTIREKDLTNGDMKVVVMKI